MSAFKVGQTISAEEFNKAYKVGQTISAGEFNKAYGKKKEEKPKTPLAQKVLGGIASFVGGKKLIEGEAAVQAQKNSMEVATQNAQAVDGLIKAAHRLPLNDPRRKELLLKAKNVSDILVNTMNGNIKELPTNKQVVGSAAKLATTIGSAGLPGAQTALGRIGQGTALGGIFGGAQGAEDNGSVVKGALIGAATGAAVTGAVEAVKYAVRGVPKLLSYTSSTPEDALKRQYDDPKAFADLQRKLREAGGEKSVLENVQGATRELRKNLTKQYQEGVETVIKTNTGKRIVFNSSERKILSKVAEQYGLDLPKQTTSVSAKEAFELNKQLNELISSNLDIKTGSEGVLVRKIKDSLSGKLYEFEGAKELLKNYAAEKSTLDGADMLFKAYKTQSPIAQATALSRLKSVFNENKGSYLSVVKDLEEATGIPLVDSVSILQTQKILPKGRFDLTNLFKDILVPLGITGPRGAGVLSRAAGRIAQSGGATEEAVKRFIIKSGAQGITSVVD